MSKISSLPPLTDEQVMQAWALLEPVVQAAITHRLHQFHDALVSRGQLAAARSDTERCVVAEAMEQAGSAEHAGCSAAADKPGSSPALLPVGRLH